MKKLVALLLSVLLICSAASVMAAVNVPTIANGVGSGIIPIDDEAAPVEETWYTNNTAGLLGLSLRDDLGLSDKWYNIVPVDLTSDVTMTLQMVASNIYYFGTATVTVADGNVTVTYEMPEGNVYLKDECLQWFTSLDQITADFLANPVGEYAFGEPVSIVDELNGQNVALLFICNHVTYRQPITATGMLTRYYNTQERWQNWRAALTEVLESMVVVDPNAATDTDMATDTDTAATETDTAEAEEAAETVEPEAAEAVETEAAAE